MSENTTCPTCGDSFKSNGGMKVHHYYKHDESIAKVILQCENCGQNYKETESREDRSRFCSEECRNEKFKDEYSGEDNPQWKDGLIKECENCGDEFRIAPWEIEEGRQYCSNECSYIIDKRSTISCEVCGNEFDTYEPERRKTCSLACQGELTTRRQSGEKHWNWKGGGSRSYGSGWIKLSSKMRDKNNCCKLCGEEKSYTMHVHHIIPVRAFKNVEDAHYKNNLVVLCRSCHGKVEWWDIPKQVETFNTNPTNIEL